MSDSASATRVGPSPSTAASAAIDPAAAIAVVDWGGLVLRAGRVGPVLPHMGWLLRFAERIGRDALQAEARRLNSSPYGFGRRIEAARVPGGRPRWRPEHRPPTVDLADVPAVGPAGLAAWLDRQLGVALDPEHDAGWRLAATPTDGGGTAVLVVCHHLFGTGPGILDALYGDGDGDRARGTTETPFTSASSYTPWDEACGVAERVRLGLHGAAHVPAELAAALRTRSRDRHADPAAPKAPRGRDRTRRPPSPLRVAAIASLPAATWDGAAAALGGTGNTLLAAVAANLLRRARSARGGPEERALRLLLPVDLQHREAAAGASHASGPAPKMTTAAVLLPGGAAEHGDLRALRARMKAAFRADAAPAVRGAGEAMRLLPEALTFRAAARAAQQFDGCASNVGVVPDGMLSLGSHRARDVVMIGFPIGNEAVTVLIRHGDRVSISVVTDPIRLGAAADLRAWLAAELAAWGLREVVW